MGAELSCDPNDIHTQSRICTHNRQQMSPLRPNVFIRAVPLGICGTIYQVINSLSSTECQIILCICRVISLAQNRLTRKI